jgi:ATP-dependent RNA helicase DDX46/PRP5
LIALYVSPTPVILFEFRTCSEAMKTDTKTRAQEAAKKLQARMGMAVASSSGAGAAAAAAGGEEPTFYSTEIEINDYPQNARWKVSNKLALDDLMERHECVIYLKGIHVAAGKKVPADERKLYLTVEGRTVMAVRNAKADIRRTLEEAALMARPDNAGRSAPGRFDMGAGTLRLM